jgi:hypothetical protein
MLAESSKLEYRQKDDNHSPYLSAYVFDLYWVCYLHAWRTGCG